MKGKADNLGHTDNTKEGIMVTQKIEVKQTISKKGKADKIGHTDNIKERFMVKQSM